jgi:hypothetical protein
MQIDRFQADSRIVCAQRTRSLAEETIPRAAQSGEGLTIGDPAR